MAISILEGKAFHSRLSDWLIDRKLSDLHIDRIENLIGTSGKKIVRQNIKSKIEEKFSFVTSSKIYLSFPQSFVKYLFLKIRVTTQLDFSLKLTNAEARSKFKCQLIPLSSKINWMKFTLPSFEKCTSMTLVFSHKCSIGGIKLIVDDPDGKYRKIKVKKEEEEQKIKVKKEERSESVNSGSSHSKIPKKEYSEEESSDPDNSYSYESSEEEERSDSSSSELSEGDVVSSSSDESTESSSSLYSDLERILKPPNDPWKRLFHSIPPQKVISTLRSNLSSSFSSQRFISTFFMTLTKIVERELKKLASKNIEDVEDCICPVTKWTLNDFRIFTRQYCGCSLRPSADKVKASSSSFSKSKDSSTQKEKSEFELVYEDEARTSLYVFSHDLVSRVLVRLPVLIALIHYPLYTFGIPEKRREKMRNQFKSIAQEAAKAQNESIKNDQKIEDGKKSKDRMIQQGKERGKEREKEKEKERKIK
ncbi:hypothetical protein ADUPG1_008336, partial [Aduncisulcus paluster]